MLIFYVFAERIEGQIELCLKSGGGLQREEWIISRHDSENVLTVNIFITYEEISYSCEDRRIQKYL